MTPEYRKAHLAHCRAYDKIYDANRRESRKFYKSEQHFLDRDRRLEMMRLYYQRNRERLHRLRSAELCAEDMIAEALS